MQSADEAAPSYAAHAASPCTPDVAALQRGALFLKYCRRGKPHACFVELLAGERELQWVTAVGKPRTLSLEAVREVLAGQQTAVFRRLPGLQPPAVSFSVIYRDGNTERTLDLVCKGREQHDVWLNGLRASVARSSARAAPPAQGRALPDEVMFWGHHAATLVTGLGAPKRDRAAPLAAGRGADAWHSKALMPTLFGRAEGIQAAAVTFGPFHGALLSSSGGVYTWGASHCGELGHGLRQHSGTPRLVDTLQRVRVRQVACGTARTAAVTDDGQLLMWGNVAASRRTRFGDTGPQWTPRVLCGPSTGVVVKHVACGPYHTAIVSADGQLYTMGEGVFGALGHGDDAHRAAPSLVSGLSSSHTVVQAACGVWHTAALATPRHASSASAPGAVELFTWGQGDRGQLGNGVKGSCELSPCRVDSGQPQTDALVRVACGAAHTAALTAAGSVLVAGKDSTGPSCASFRRVLGPLADVRVDQLACGDKHTCVAASAHGLLFTWGTGAGGRLGHGGERDEDLPKLVESLRGRVLRSITCGPECTSAICAPHRLTTEDKAAMAKAQDEAGWSVAEADTQATPDAASPTASMADVGRALRAAKVWKAVTSVAPLADGAARVEHSQQQIASDAQIAALQRELSSARDEAQLLRAQVAASEARAERTQMDASTMTDAIRQVQLREPPQPPPAVVARPVAAAPPPPVEEVITVSPGVHVVAVGRLIRRVRFDRRLFSDEQAVDWWEHQRDKVLGEHHLVCVAAPPRATTASATVR